MNEEDTYQTLAGQILDPIVRQSRRVIDWSGRVFEGRSQELQGVPAAQRNEEVRPIGTPAVLNGQPVKWAGQNYGWQSEASYNQLQKEGEFRFGEITGQRIMGDITQGVGQVIKSIPEPIKQTAVDVAKAGAAQAAEAYYSLPLYQQQQIVAGLQFVRGGVNFVGDFMEEVSRRTNTSRFITDELVTLGTGKVLKAGFTATKPAVTQAVKTGVRGLADLADDLMTPPTGMVPALAGAAPMSTPVSIRPNIKGGSVFMSTTSPEWTSPKAGLGSAADPKYAPAVERFEARESAWQEVINTLKESYKAGNISEAKLKKEISEIQSIRKGDLSTFDYNPEDLYSFFEGLKESPYSKQTRKRGELKTLQEARPQDPYDVLKKAQQHHVLAKAETKPFVETLMRLMNEGVANKDDLVNFFVWPEKYDLVPGNVRKNLLDMGEITHTTAKKDPMALHNLLKEAGLEYGSRTGPEMIKRYGLDKVTSADELMQAYDRYLQEIAIPSRDIAYKAHDWWYNKTIKTLKGKELAEFKANFAKLRDPRRSP
jgi:hypothetical protein